MRLNFWLVPPHIFPLHLQLISGFRAYSIENAIAVMVPIRLGPLLPPHLLLPGKKRPFDRGADQDPDAVLADSESIRTPWYVSWRQGVRILHETASTGSLITRGTFLGHIHKRKHLHESPHFFFPLPCTQICGNIPTCPTALPFSGIVKILYGERVVLKVDLACFVATALVFSFPLLTTSETRLGRGLPRA